MRTRGCRVKPIGEILRFVGHQSFAEFHDAHRVRWYAVIGKYEFGDPELATSDNSPDRKTLLVWLDQSALLNVVPAADPLARLRIINYSILVVDFMFELEIARVRGIPMAPQRDVVTDLVQLCQRQFETRGVNAPSIAEVHEPSGFVEGEDIPDAIAETLCNVPGVIRERL